MRMRRFSRRRGSGRRGGMSSRRRGYSSRRRGRAGRRSVRPLRIGYRF